MKKIVVFLFITCICFSLYANNTMINEAEYLLYENNVYETEKLLIGNVSEEKLIDDSIDCIDAFAKDDTECINTDTLYQTQYFATYYFYNLRENMGYNYIGSCSYVAIAMMLSYYDTYWDDTIIDDSYDLNSLFEKTEYVDGILTYSELTLHNFENSPGIRENERLPFDESERLGLSDDERLTEEQYYQLVKNQNNRNRYFHYYLMGMMITEEFYASRVGEGINPFGLGVDGRSQLIEDYLESLNGKLTYETVTTDVENYIIENVSRGTPVLVAVDLPNQKVGHVLVVYDYDASTGKLYANLGGSDGLTHVDLSSLNCTSIKNATTFTPTGSHSHSNNYVYLDGSTYCSCYFPCHPEHEHEYEACVGAESTHHVYKCGCTAEGNVTLFHNFEYVNITANGHQEVCSDCGYERDVHEHSFQYTNTSDINHNARCSHCRYETTKPHTFECDGVENGLHYEKCVDCGYRESRMSNPQYTQLGESGHSKECVHCGYEVNDSHTFVQTSDGSLGHILTCKYCGQTSGTHEGHLYTAYDDMFSKCKICGYLKRNNGGFTPIIKTKLPNKDEETE